MTELHAGPTVGGLILQALRRYPDRQAIVDERLALTYAQAETLIAGMQHAIVAAGAKPGDGVAILSSNRVENYLASAAVSLCGLRNTALHPMGSLHDHISVLEDAETKFLIVDPLKHADRGGELAAQAAGLDTVFTLGPADLGIDLLAAAEAAGVVSATDLATPDMLATLNYTGGTTGRPKGAVRSHTGNVAIANATLADFEFSPGLRYLATTPISHVGGTKILPTLLRGGTVYMQAAFDPEGFLDAVARYRITATLLVPTMVYVLLDHPALKGADVSSLDMVLYGASPMSPSRLGEAIDRFGPVFCQLYGQTECYPISYLARADHDPANPDLLLSCGMPVASADVRLLDDDGQPVAEGQPGEICVRARQAMDGYWKRADETAATLQDGWLHTGDVARRDERGYLYIVDRKKDMIVSGGFNVYPREVEDVLTSHPDVAMAAVIGVPDEKWGEAVKAVVVPRAGAQIDAEALRALVRNEKGGVHTPKSVDIADAIPLTAIGKPDKKALRAQYWGEASRQVG